uniref:Uncharacterized protein n=1 Tax=Molossus molossus TaxID=27622 RepID=A0A7J8JV66_MOLMO|nr:hypothetical protein HJG59_007802 [Molossus molossus]
MGGKLARKPTNSRLEISVPYPLVRVQKVTLQPQREGWHASILRMHTVCVCGAMALKHKRDCVLHYFLPDFVRSSVLLWARYGAKRRLGLVSSHHELRMLDGVTNISAGTDGQLLFPMDILRDNEVYTVYVAVFHCTPHSVDEQTQ